MAVLRKSRPSVRAPLFVLDPGGSGERQSPLLHAHRLQGMTEGFRLERASEGYERIIAARHGFESFSLPDTRVGGLAWHAPVPRPP